MAFCFDLVLNNKTEIPLSSILSIKLLLSKSFTYYDLYIHHLLLQLIPN